MLQLIHGENGYIDNMEKVSGNIDFPQVYTNNL